MNPDKTFQFYIKKDSNTYYTVKDGNVIETSVKTPLKYAPDGWDDIGISYIRNKDYYGVFRSVTVDLRFVLDGRQVLKSLYLKDGEFASAKFHVEILDTYSLSYTPFYESDFDFTMIEIQENYLSITTIDGGLPGLIKNRKDTTYEIPLNVSGKLLSLYIDGVKIRNVINYTPLTNISKSAQQNVTLTAAPYLGEFYRLSDLGKGYMIPNVGGEEIDPDDVTNYFYMASTNDPVKVTLDNIHFLGDTLTIIRFDKDGNPYSGSGNQWVFIGAGNIPHTEITFNMVEGDRLVMRGHAEAHTPGSGTVTAAVIIEDLDAGSKARVTVEGVILYKPTYSYCYRYFDFIELFVSKMTNGLYGVKSDFLTNPDVSSSFRASNFDNSPYYTMITSGKALRSPIAPAEMPLIKTSFNDIAKDLFARCGCGIGIEGNDLRIEPVKYFFNSSKELFYLKSSRVSSLKISLYNSFNQNSNILVGYGNYNYGMLNGIDEPNTSQQYLFDARKTSMGTEDYTTKFRSDMYGIEKQRNLFNPDAIGVEQIETVDSEADNDVFVIEADPTPLPSLDYKLYRPVGNIVGMDYPETAYNLTLTPKRALFRILPFLKGIVSRGYLRFQTTDKSPRLQSDFFSGNIIENSDVNLEDGEAAPLFQWSALEIEAAPPYNMYQIMNNSLFGYISFEYKGNVFKGFILDVGCTPATRDKYTFKLLSHPDNDLSKLV